MTENLGVQLYTVRNFLGSAQEIRSTLGRIKAMGYETVQTNITPCVSIEEFGKLIGEAGLTICGHFGDFAKMVADPAAAMAEHDALGTKGMGIGYAGSNVEGFSEEYMTRLLADFNSLARSIAPGGFRFSYHNHAHEFSRYAGTNQTAFDFMIENTDPQVAFCFDTFWAQYGGVDPKEYIRRLAGRIDILHLKDFGRTPSEVFTAAIGDGNLNWEPIIAAALDSGVKFFVVEQDDCRGEDPFRALERSREYLGKFFK